MGRVNSDKERLIETFSNLPGFEGCGVGQHDSLCVLVKDDGTKALIPATFNGRKVEVFVTGGIRLLSEVTNATVGA